jgi:anti-sigma factor RsiW
MIVALSCQELVELVTDYLEGTLDDLTRARFEQHVARCDGCAAYLEQMRQTVKLVGRLQEDQLSEPARTKLLNAFRDWRERES